MRNVDGTIDKLGLCLVCLAAAIIVGSILVQTWVFGWRLPLSKPLEVHAQKNQTSQAASTDDFMIPKDGSASRFTLSPGESSAACDGSSSSIRVCVSGSMMTLGLIAEEKPAGGTITDLVNALVREKAEASPLFDTKDEMEIFSPAKVESSDEIKLLAQIQQSSERSRSFSR